jgi:hypothetical protein
MSTPLKRNLAPEIRMSQQRSLEILPSVLLLFPMSLLLLCGGSTEPYTFESSFSG